MAKTPTPSFAVSLKEIEKKYGKGAVRKLDGEATTEVQAISTGSALLDAATGIGGYPMGRVVEVYGPESAGKTTLTLHAIAEVQKLGMMAAFVDAEHAFDATYAQQIGVRPDALYISQPSCAEEALDVVEAMCKSGDFGLVVIDSVAAMTPRAEIEGDMDDHHVGLQARVLGKGLRKITGVASKSGTCVIFINQLRMKVGVSYGSPEVTPGGKALKFFSSMRFDIRRIKTLKQGDDAYGNRVRVKVVKNKLAPPFKQAEFEITYGVGINVAAETIDAAMEAGVVTRSGAWFYMGEERLGQGRANVLRSLLDDADLLGLVRDATASANKRGK